MAKVGLAFLGAAMLVTSGVVYGLQTDRWGRDQALEDAAEKLAEVPADFGQWTGEELEIPSEQLKVAEAVGHISRRYTNMSTGESVDVLVLCGRHGPISVHPPTVCFVASGYSLDAAPQRTTVEVKIEKGTATFWVADFQKSADGVPHHMRTFWAWTADGRWSVPDNPRVTFAGQPVLYKLYISRTLSGPSELDDDDASIEFLKDFLPVLHETGLREF